MITRARFMGGSQDLGAPSADFDIAPAAGRVVRVSPAAGSLKGKMPSALTFPYRGGPIAYVMNFSGANAFTLADVGGNTIASVGANQVAIVCLINNQSANGLWAAVVKARLS